MDSTFVSKCSNGSPCAGRYCSPATYVFQTLKPTLQCSRQDCNIQPVGLPSVEHVNLEGKLRGLSGDGCRGSENPIGPISGPRQRTLTALSPTDTRASRSCKLELNAFDYTALPGGAGDMAVPLPQVCSRTTDSCKRLGAGPPTWEELREKTFSF